MAEHRTAHSKTLVSRHNSWLGFQAGVKFILAMTSYTRLLNFSNPIDADVKIEL
jgi:hypothetical protein